MLRRLTHVHPHTHSSKGSMFQDKNGKETMRFNRMSERGFCRKVPGTVSTRKLQLNNRQVKVCHKRKECEQQAKAGKDMRQKGSVWEMAVVLLLMAAELFHVLSFFDICWDVSFPRQRAVVCKAMGLSRLKSQVIPQVNWWAWFLLTEATRESLEGKEDTTTSTSPHQVPSLSSRCFKFVSYEDEDRSQLQKRPSGLFPDGLRMGAHLFAPSREGLQGSFGCSLDTHAGVFSKCLGP